jgi:hypothetical protein
MSVRCNQTWWGTGVTYVNNILDLAEDSGDGCTDEGHSVEETGLSNEDVEKSLMHADELMYRLASYCW